MIFNNDHCVRNLCTLIVICFCYSHLSTHAMIGLVEQPIRAIFVFLPTDSVAVVAHHRCSLKPCSSGLFSCQLFCVLPPQAASCPQWQLQVPPGGGDLQACSVLHGQTSQTWPPGQQGGTVWRALCLALRQKPL